MTEAIEFHNVIEIHTIHMQLGLWFFLFISLMLHHVLNNIGCLP